MKKLFKPVVSIVVFSILLSACGHIRLVKVVPTPSPEATLTPAATRIEPVITPTSEPSPTLTPEPTAGFEREKGKSGDRYYEEEGGFSYIVPENWELEEHEEREHLYLTKNHQSGTASSTIVFSVDTFSGSLDLFSNSSLTALTEYPEVVELLYKEEKITENGLPYVEFAAIANPIYVDNYLMQFIFDMGLKKLTIFYVSDSRNLDEELPELIGLINSLEFEAQVYLSENRIMDEAGGFSYILPQNWLVIEVPDVEYMVATRLDNLNQTVAAMEVSVNESTRDLDFYLESAIVPYKLTKEYFEIIEKGHFETDQGLTCYYAEFKFVMEIGEGKLFLYIFEFGHSKYTFEVVVAPTVLQSAIAEIQAIINSIQFQD